MATTTNVCFIGGAGHSGSTLVGLMLGAHPEVFYAGEARKSLFLGDLSKPLKKRVCKLCGEDCPIWSRLPSERRAGEDLYQTLARMTGARIVVDSTKNIDWIERTEVRSPHSLIFLARDGRAVVTSRLRKYPETPVREHARQWAEQLRATAALVERFDGPVLRLRYEELASAPDHWVPRLAEFLAIEWVPEMLAPWTTRQHPLGGNNGTQSLMDRSQDAEVHDKRRSYYEQHPRGIVLDLRWKRELSDDALAEFQAVAGDVNQPYEWDAKSP